MSTSFRKLPFSVEMSPVWIKHIYSVSCVLTWRPQIRNGILAISKRSFKVDLHKNKRKEEAMILINKLLITLVAYIYSATSRDRHRVFDIKADCKNVLISQVDFLPEMSHKKGSSVTLPLSLSAPLSYGLVPHLSKKNLVNYLCLSTQL